MNAPSADTQTRSQRERSHLESESSIEIWREAMQHLRHLNGDVWKTFALYLSLNLVLLLSIAALLLLVPHSSRGLLLILIVDVAGLLLTLAGRYLFKRHRVYYLQMLAKKTLLEVHLGFYETQLAGSTMDLAFPWRLTPEVAAEIGRDHDAWVAKSIRAPGTIARIQFWIFEAAAGIYLAVLFTALQALFMQ